MKSLGFFRGFFLFCSFVKWLFLFICSAFYSHTTTITFSLQGKNNFHVRLYIPIQETEMGRKSMKAGNKTGGGVHFPEVKEVLVLPRGSKLPAEKRGVLLCNHFRQPTF